MSRAVGKVTVEREKITLEAAPAPPPPAPKLPPPAARPTIKPLGPPVKHGTVPRAIGCVGTTFLAGCLFLMALSSIVGHFSGPAGVPTSKSYEPPPGGYRAWDPIKQLAWVQRIAKAWSSEAVLYRIDVTGAARGLVDLGPSTGSDVTYRFWPSAKMASYDVESAGPTVVIGRELWIRIKGDLPWAIMQELEPDPKRPVAARSDIDSLTLTDLFARLDARPDFPEAARYTGALDYDTDGWTWQLTDGAGATLLIRARDAQVLQPLRPPSAASSSPSSPRRSTAPRRPTAASPRNSSEKPRTP